MRGKEGWSIETRRAKSKQKDTEKFCVFHFEPPNPQRALRILKGFFVNLAPFAISCSQLSNTLPHRLHVSSSLSQPIHGAMSLYLCDSAQGFHSPAFRYIVFQHRTL